MNILELLNKAAELEKKAYADYVTNFTQAGIVALVKGGVVFEKAAEMMKQACEREELLARLQTNAIAFEKAAEYIGELETKVSGLEKVAQEQAVEIKTLDEKDPMHKLAASGFFSDEELDMMAQMPRQLVEKVASVGAQPDGMGSAVGVPREKTDPLLEFLLA